MSEAEQFKARAQICRDARTSGSRLSREWMSELADHFERTAEIAGDGGIYVSSEPPLTYHATPE
jgi:hypothetical protein